MMPPLPKKWDTPEGVELDESDSTIPAALSQGSLNSSDEGTLKRGQSEDSDALTPKMSKGPAPDVGATGPIPAVPIRTAPPAPPAKKQKRKVFDLDSFST